MWRYKGLALVKLFLRVGILFFSILNTLRVQVGVGVEAAVAAGLMAAMQPSLFIFVQNMASNL